MSPNLLIWQVACRATKGGGEMSKIAVLLAVFALVGMLAALAAPPACAAEYHNVAGLEPWPPESNYMSLAGCLRWMTFREQGVWLSMGEAKRIVNEQLQQG